MRSLRGAVAAVTLAVTMVVGACSQSATDQTERGVNGTITAPGRLGVKHLQSGDCIRDELADVVESVIGVPCSRPHHAQVIVADDLDAIEIGDPSAVDVLCGAEVFEITSRLVDRDDLPIIDVSLLIEEDAGRVACVLEFDEPITEDLVRTVA
ncbi:MAG: hypothetical protein AAF081_13950 [Actinomycetota bacterium]